MNKMRVAILKELKKEIVSAYELAKGTKAKRHEKEFIREMNHLYSKDIIIPIYEAGQQYFMCK
jgi:hypothetical protein